MRTCFSLKAPQSDFRPGRMAFNSRKFMWYLCSSVLQNPPVEVSPQTAPQPTFEASVVKVRSRLPWLMGLDAVRTLFTHHVNSVLDWTYKVIMESKFPLLAQSAEILSSSKCQKCISANSTAGKLETRKPMT